VKQFKKYEVWMAAEHDMCDSVNGGIKFGEAFANTFEEACAIVMTNLNNKRVAEGKGPDPYWKPEDPSRYWGRRLCQNETDAYRRISVTHPSHPHYGSPYTVVDLAVIDLRTNVNVCDCHDTDNAHLICSLLNAVTTLTTPT